MFEQFILGTIQGVAEWLPVSSTSLLILAQQHLFGSQDGFQDLTRHIMFLHLGTFLAAAIYFRRDVLHLVQAMFRYRAQTPETQKLLVFLVVATPISGALGLFFRNIITDWTGHFASAGKPISLIIGLFLLVTAFGQLKIRSLKGHKGLKDLTLKDGVILGLVQGCAAIPGLSRSGLTVAALLLRQFDREYALKVSFLMSLPIVLGANILLNLRGSAWTWQALFGVFVSFTVGLASIHLLLRLAHKINFGYFVLVFAVLTILSVFV
ncbi:MAG: undecaprenyl-diphosphate phosphatase [Candidatus Omnitrophica bacterium]|nr:undecaprenyl-diphosphate phosphatase [Candidatus Omnitrophota bacterium]